MIILAAQKLKPALDSTPKVSPLILTNGRGLAWTSGSFRKAWARVSRQAGIKDLKFADLRGTAVTRMAKRGATHIEISAVTGHSVRDVGRILQAHYLAQDPEIAANAIRKLEGERL